MIAKALQSLSMGSQPQCLLWLALPLQPKGMGCSGFIVPSQLNKLHSNPISRSKQSFDQCAGGETVF